MDGSGNGASLCGSSMRGTCREGSFTGDFERRMDGSGNGASLCGSSMRETCREGSFTGDFERRMDGSGNGASLCWSSMRGTWREGSFTGAPKGYYYYYYYYLTAIGLTPSGSSTAHIYTQTVHRIQRTEHA
jgi:hypothetical protein